MITAPTASEIQARMLTRLRDEAGITADSPSSIAFALTAGVANEIASLYGDIAQAEAANSINRAVGAELDKLGEFFGVPRLQAQKATTQGFGPAVIFRNNGVGSITIPGGTGVFPSRQPTLLFRTTRALTLPSLGQGSVDVTAEGAGPEYNVGSGALNSHNAGYAQITVTNPRPIDSGRGVESDESYRNRLARALTLRNPGSKESIRILLSGLPGIRDVRLREGVSGPGSFEVLLIGEGNSVPAESVTQAQAFLSDYAPIGVIARVTLPRPVPVDIDARLDLTPSKESERAALVITTEQVIRDYIDSLSVEEGNGEGEFIATDLTERIGFALPDARDYNTDVTIADTPLQNGENWLPQPGERLYPRRIRVE